MTRLRYLIAWIVGKGGGLFLSLFLLLISTPLYAQTGDNRAGIVIVHSDGRIVTRCVPFSEPQISGLDLLERSGLPFSRSVGPLGATICAVDNEGCPTSNCFCKCKGNPCVYWNYYNWAPNGGWLYANLGASMRQVRNGDVDGWVWGNGEISPPLISFKEICGSEVIATQEAPPVPTSVPASATPVPTLAPTPTPRATLARSTLLKPSSTPPEPTLSPPPSPTSPSRSPTVPVTIVAVTATTMPLEEPTTPSLFTATATPTHDLSGTPELGAHSRQPLPKEYFTFLTFLSVIGFAFLVFVRKRGA